MFFDSCLLLAFQPKRHCQGHFVLLTILYFIRMRIHFISIGGALMHNLALALQAEGHEVSGSDDELYEPSRSRLAAAGLLPSAVGWDAGRIVPGIDAVVVGMHAKADNPELRAALALGLRLYSYPELLYERSRNKRRIVVAGSHGKTTTTGLIMHVLRSEGMDFDYAVGAAVDGFDCMVRLSAEAPLLVVEGDEYGSSPLDPRPKLAHYRPHIAVLTGLAWDHANIYPNPKQYARVFKHWLMDLDGESTLIYFKDDAALRKSTKKAACSTLIGYGTPGYYIENGITHVKYRLPGGGIQSQALHLFGEHNLQNMEAARQVCKELGISRERFWAAAATYTGAAGRLQKLSDTPDCTVFRDFAHAPSKVRATVRAVRAQYPHRRLLAFLELHTYSSLHADFLPQYAGSLSAADEAWVYYNPKTLTMKRLPDLDPEYIKTLQLHPRLRVFTDAEQMHDALSRLDRSNSVLLFMSSGNWGGLMVNG